MSFSPFHITYKNKNVMEFLQWPFLFSSSSSSSFYWNSIFKCMHEFFWISEQQQQQISGESVWFSFSIAFKNHWRNKKWPSLNHHHHQLRAIGDRWICVRHLNQSTVFLRLVLIFKLTFGFIWTFFMIVKFRGIGKRRRFIRKIHQWWFECAMKI